MTIAKRLSTRLLFLGLLAVAAAETKMDGKKPAPEKSATFYVPADAKTVDKREIGHLSGGDYLLRKGADVRLVFRPGVCFVESGARVAIDSWHGKLVVKKGGVVTKLDGWPGKRLHLCYEKGATIPKRLDKSIVVEEYDTIILKPLPTFTLRGVIRQGSQIRSGVAVYAFAPDGRSIGDTVTDHRGAFALRSPKPVGRLVADLGEMWSRFPSLGGDLEFRRRVNVLHGWETEIKEGHWEKDADIPMVRAVRAEPTMPAPAVLLAHEQSVNQLIYSRDGSMLATISSANRPCVWDIKARKVLRRFSLEAPTRLAAFHPSGKVLALSIPGGIGLWDIKTGERLHEFRGHPQAAHCAAFSPDGRILAWGGADGAVRILDLTGGTTRTIAKVHQNGVTSLVFSADGKSLVSTGVVPRSIPNITWDGPDVVRVWDTATARAIRTFVGEADLVARSADGRYQAGEGSVVESKEYTSGRVISDRPQLFIWDAESGRQLVKAQSDAIVLTFTPDNRFLLTATKENVCVWEAETGKEVLTCSLPQEDVTALAFSPDARTLAAGQKDGRVYLWEVRPSRLYVPEDRPLSEAEQEKRWTDLAADKAATAYRALWTLQGDPARAVTLLRNRLRPARGEAPPKEAERRRISPEELRSSRAIYLLEQIGSPEARELLETLAKGASEAPQTREAKAALARLSK